MKRIAFRTNKKKTKRGDGARCRIEVRGNIKMRKSGLSNRVQGNLRKQEEGLNPPDKGRISNEGKGWGRRQEYSEQGKQGFGVGSREWIDFWG